MNDRYLFKAKSSDTGEWVIGSYHHQTDYYGEKFDEHYIIVGSETNTEGYGEHYIIDKSTICQCTGLKDKNGTLIWENDLVLTPREDGYSLICWSDTEARWEMHNEEDGIVLDFDHYWANEVEVVGNRFDNPELMEVE